MKVIAYTYEADIHCIPCATERWGAEALADTATEDREGNPLHPVFGTDEWLGGAWCGDCAELLIEPGNEENK